MIPWAHRPLEVANLLNPAFCGLLVHEAVREYYRTSSEAMPIPLLHLALPVALHTRTRNVLPGNTRARLHPWMEANPHVRVRFAQRVRALRTPVREGVLFAASDDLIRLQGSGLFPVRKGPAAIPSSWTREAESYECWRAAGFVARWFSAASGTASIFALWGVKP